MRQSSRCRTGCHEHQQPPVPDAGPATRFEESGVLPTTIIILLLVIIGLAIALILTISGDDDSAGQSHETIQAETIEPDSTLGSDGGADSDASKTASDSDAATHPAILTATVAPLPTEDATSGTVEDPDALLAEHQRDSEDPYALGDVDADIVVVQYADYRCGYCALWHVEVFELLIHTSNRPGPVRVPRPSGPWGRLDLRLGSGTSGRKSRTVLGVR